MIRTHGRFGQAVQDAGVDLDKQDFAERIGTSRSRLSTYMSGKVVPSATLMVRMRRVALHASPKPAGTTLTRELRAE